MEQPLHQLRVIHLVSIIELSNLCPFLSAENLREELFLNAEDLFPNSAGVDCRLKIDKIGVEQHILLEKRRDEIDDNKAKHDLNVHLSALTLVDILGMYVR